MFDYKGSQDDAPYLQKKLFWMIGFFMILVALMSAVTSVMEGLHPKACIQISSAVLFLASIMLLCFRTKKYSVCYTIMILLVNCYLLPVTFFYCGGLFSGMPLYLLAGFFICAFCMNTKSVILTTALSAIVDVILFALEILHPEFVYSVPQQTLRFDIIISICILAAAVLGITLTVLHEYRKQQTMELNNGIIDVLGTAVEFRNVESGEHVRRIKGFTKILLRHVNEVYEDVHYSPEEINIISAASAMHDIGKISVPDGILLKPGRLTPDEYEKIKEHTLRGCEIINSMKDFQEKRYYKYCYEICRYHHERYDGKGYPDGLKGEAIPLPAQIVSVADVYDALINTRCYKGAYTPEESYNMIVNGECGTFSPKILECLARSREEMEAFSQDKSKENLN